MRPGLSRPCPAPLQAPCRAIGSGRHPGRTHFQAPCGGHELATYAGHRSMQTTLLYIHLSGQDLAEKLARTMGGPEGWLARALHDRDGAAMGQITAQQLRRGLTKSHDVGLAILGDLSSHLDLASRWIEVTNL